MSNPRRLCNQLVYGNGVGTPLAQSVQIAELQGLMKRCHDIIRDNENLSPITAFSVISRILCAKQFDEISTLKRHFYMFQTISSESDDTLSEIIRDLYTNAIGSHYQLFDPSLGIRRSETIREVVRLLQGYSFASLQVDTKGEAYQSFLSKVMRGPAGQYFTPREVVRPIVEIISPKENEKIIDPCCGTGGFLIYSSQYLLQTRHGPLTRKQDASRDHKLIGIEVDNNIAESGTISMKLEGGMIGRIIVANALSDFNDPNLRLARIERGGFDIVMTNPPFGKKTRLGDVANRFQLSKAYKTPSFETLLVERSLELLKPGGRCAIVLPDVALTNKPLLNFLYANAIILGVVSLPPDTFRPYGPSVKASVLFFKKKIRPDEETVRIFMSRIDEIGYDSTGRKTGKNKFEEIVPLFNQFFEEGSLGRTERSGFLCFVKDFVDSEIFENLGVEAQCGHLQEMRNFLPLIEVAKVFRGFTPAWDEYKKAGIPIIKVKNLHNQNVDFCFERRGYVSEEIYEGHPEAHLQLNDIVLTASAHSPEYIAKKIDIIDSLPFEKCMAVSELIIIRAYPSKIDPFYLASVLRKSEINEQFRTCVRGTTAHIYPRDVERRVFIPNLPLDRQQKIGGSLRGALADFRRFESCYHNFEDQLDRLLSDFSTEETATRGGDA